MQVGTPGASAIEIAAREKHDNYFRYGSFGKPLRAET